jgi:uncharacterized membrane protein YraQ (UPF0718 family)
VFIKVYADSNKMRKLFMKKAALSIPGAVAAGALTPLCACGTMAVLLAMFVSSMPWGTVMAFLISSPLTSPSEYLFETAFFGGKFATGVLMASIVLGLLAGFAAHLLEKRTNFFRDQFRLVKDSSKGCGCPGEDEAAACSGKQEKYESCCGPKQTGCCSRTGFIKRYKIDMVLSELWNTGVRKILLYFIIFIAVGRAVEAIIPGEWIMALFSSDKAYSVPLAATIGLPLYLSDSSAIPLLKSLINSGAGEGAVMAFIIAGKATGIPVMAGMAAFMKKKAMLFYIGFIYFGAILAGYLFQMF